MMIFTVAIIVAGLAITDLLVEPYVQWRDQLKSQSTANQLSLSENRTVLEKKRTMESAQAEALLKLPGDPAIAEGQLLHQLHQWEQESGVSNTSFQRMQSRDEGGFNLLSYHITADGSMIQTAKLMLRLESTKTFLRLDELHIIPKHNAEDILQLQANLATLCKASTVAHERVAVGVP